ncbi:ROK family transcriptional regulator [Microbacterium betulae]|uniref:ROK family transcriptional regulator n=1 Tax=Microbacterium betulae TaxID=2981139 RepID=A0AA97FHX4_9MICO|nr:ROK family transcriptional regulator [Microbacterium sp. AB]WOF23546.1 ROK family transcriptional regulator [Microbacterium sp. AB]
MGADWGEQDGSAHAVALEVLVSGPIARSDLARRLGLSQSSLSRLTKPLVESGLLVEADVAEPQGRRVGRPTQPLDVVPGTRRFVGIKVTAEAAHGVLTDLRCAEIDRFDVALASRSVEDVVAAVAAVVARLTRRSAADGVGVSISGPVVGGRTVVDSPFLGWREEVGLADLVEEATGLPATLSNDLVALTHAEQWFGAGRLAENVAVITIGAGVGFGLIAGGRVVQSPDDGVSPISHVPLDRGGPMCFAGHRGCAVALLTIDAICSQVSIGLGRSVGYEEVLRLAREGDPVPAAVVSAAGRAIGLLIALAADFSFARTVVVSGEGDGLVDIARPEIDAAIPELRDPRAAPIELIVRPADFVEWARGAAAMAIRAHVLG